MNDFDTLCYKTGIADQIKTKPSHTPPRWMNDFEIKLWKQGKSRAERVVRG